MSKVSMMFHDVCVQECHGFKVKNLNADVYIFIYLLNVHNAYRTKAMSDGKKLKWWEYSHTSEQ